MQKLLFLCWRFLTLLLFTSFVNLFSENLSYLSTEKSHPLTALLSRIMHKDCLEGLRLLHQVDIQVVTGLHEFVNNYFAPLSKLIDTTRANNGRCFLVGAGSSGRIALDIAARCSHVSQLIGIIAGGDCAFIRAREGFEDSESYGQSAMQDYNITSHDLVILISASGSAAFNIGCAKKARDAGATVCYFYNSAQVPAKTQILFDQLGVIPIVVDIGPQAITGSTRLQAATLARLALGSLFVDEHPNKIIEEFMGANAKIAERLHDIVHIVQLEYDTFSDPRANFRKIKDESTRGYVTFVGDKTVLRDIVMDTVETPPTFSINPPRMLQETGKKRAEFQACLADVKDTAIVWQTLIGRSLNKKDFECALQFAITEEALFMRPLEQGNLLIGVAWEDPNPLMASFKLARQRGARTALILLAERTITDIKIPECDVVLILDGLPHDSTGLIASVTLKQVLNMISNSTMILMNKVDGNRMIDVNASNNKLIDRAIRLTQDILTDYRCNATFDYETVEVCMREILKRKKEYEEKNIYTPAPVKIAVVMMYRTVNFEDAITLLHDYQENLEKICL